MNTENELKLPGTGNINLLSVAETSADIPPAPVVGLDNYVDLAMKTKVDKRLTIDPDTAISMLKLALEMRELGRKMDAHKCRLFYSRTESLCDEMHLARLHVDLTQQQTDLLHGAMGVVTEAAELLETVWKHVMELHPLDSVNIKEEVGDSSWYHAIILNAIDCPMQAAMQANIDKLRARFGDKFTEEAALNRDLNTERKVLEQV